ncbi:hypothetical protein [Ramlibacter sp. Leaf400]|uniref:hypothetical protein n=1 Tax=Ramlibacter sp. Leaf400 TaxID=1736365 RepID=UPI001910854A|nr:hypothetical protein [Ramlibacter sp. Leaf400]
MWDDPADLSYHSVEDARRGGVYQTHPSAALNSLFRDRPFQGASPDLAQFVFIGLDANYAPALEQSSIYDSVLEYHRDGVSFWRRHGFHHPFLSPMYRGDGRRYHQNFARLGFQCGDAANVSFVELLHVPTVGRNKLEVTDFSVDHLGWIDSLISAGKPQHFFLSASVMRLMLASRRFAWLTSQSRSSEILPVLYSRGATKVHLHLHLSNYGKFQAQMDQEAAAISWLARTASNDLTLGFFRLGSGSAAC